MLDFFGLRPIQHKANPPSLGRQLKGMQKGRRAQRGLQTRHVHLCRQDAAGDGQRRRRTRRLALGETEPEVGNVPQLLALSFSHSMLSVDYVQSRFCAKCSSGTL
jgi:hypothetical protein